MHEARGLDAAYAELLRAGEQAPAIRQFLEKHGDDPWLMLGVLRRAVPVRLLETVAATEPWSRDQRLLAAVVLNPRSPRALSLRLVSSLLWRELVDVAVSPRADAAVRVRAEALLREQLPDLRLGDRVTLARLAPQALLPDMLADGDGMVLEAGLLNPRLGEEALVRALRQDLASPALLEAVAASVRWRERYAVRLALVLQPRSPAALALAQLTSLVPHDLRRVAEAEGLRPVVQMAAQRLLEERGSLTPGEAGD